jgi:hypothetical protein
MVDGLSNIRFGWLLSAWQWDICKWQRSIKIWQIDCLSLLKTTHRVSLPNDDLPFGNTKPALHINVLVLPVAMLGAFDRDVEALVLFFHLSLVLHDCLDDMGVYLKMWMCIGKLYLTRSLAGPYYLPLYLSHMYFNSTKILRSNLHSNGTRLCHLFSVVYEYY